MKRIDTAIVLFTRLPHDESKLQDSLLPRLHAELFRRLTAHFSRQASQIQHSDTLFCLATHNPQPAENGFYQQRGDTFGRRLANLFRDLFERGYPRVIAVANDCPEMSAHDLTVAVRALHTHDCVIGPAENGGCYLIGLCGGAPDFLADVHWQKRTDCSELAQVAVRRGRSLVLLDMRLTIDTLDDLRRFAARHRRQPAFHRLIGFVDACLSEQRARRDGICRIEPGEVETNAESPPAWDELLSATVNTGENHRHEN